MVNLTGLPRLRPALAAAVFAVVAAGCAAPLDAAERFATERAAVTVEPVAGGLVHPWGLAFLPDGHMLVTERAGRLRIVSPDGEVSEPISGLPEIWSNFQGGLLDVILGPDYAETGRIYVSYSEPGEGGASTAVARAVLDRDDRALRDLKVIFRQQPKSSGGRHFGSRLVFAQDGTLFITIGDRGQRERAQTFTINRGQVIRINPDGSIPDDNPFVGVDGRLPEVWSYGHRNAQGAALHPETGQLWLHEHAAQGGDEVNVPQAGKNYGWPTIHYGEDYGGGQFGQGTRKPGMEQPIYYWDPSIAPSGMAFYTSDRVPAWQGDLFVGALKYRLLVRLDVEDGEIVHEERMLGDLRQRIRAVDQGPDGNLYLLTDAQDGQILRVSPRPLY
jgi:glucose/arabinose dehydrogenase